MADPLTQPIGDAYDRVAGEYARRMYDELRHKPLDRQLLDRFVAATSGQGEVCDMGCGPGHVAHYLYDAGSRVAGLDLSPGMLACARALNPAIPFREGNMLALNLADNALAGITAFYAIANLPEALLPAVFAEMHRVLEPGGLLLIAFHIGAEMRHLTEFLDQPVSLDFYFFETPRISRMPADAGLRVEEVIERDPYPDVEFPTRRAYIFARKPPVTR